ncbi:hypothetical protein SAMN05518672_101604 [Chitinophaga sp. CF118]|nr:hypothetical protein SAMN05518672_101604 [Chitinophaga sp. CF118]
MTKIVSTLAVSMGLFLRARAQQDLAGFHTENYTRVNGISFSSASIPNNYYRWDKQQAN